MKAIDHAFIEKIKEKTPKNISITDEIASILGISYDAAYRRINEKVPFTLKESVILSKKFDISLNGLYEINEPNSYLVRQSKPINSIDDIKTYFQKLHVELEPLVGREDASIIFGARELPMFYFFHNPLLIRFKIFIWNTILNLSPTQKKIKFKDFHLSDFMIRAAQKTGNAYHHINTTEVWSFGSVNNVLQQLLYLYKMRQITQDEALDITEALIREINSIEQEASSKKQINRKFELYSNELIMMNNSMIMRFKDKLHFGYPYALLRFFIIDNQKAAKTQEAYIYEQMQHAICITNTSIKERANFFNRKYDKIKQVLKVIENEENKPPFL